MIFAIYGQVTGQFEAESIRKRLDYYFAKIINDGRKSTTEILIPFRSKVAEVATRWATDRGIRYKLLYPNFGRKGESNGKVSYQHQNIIVSHVDVIIFFLDQNAYDDDFTYQFIRKARSEKITVKTPDSYGWERTHVEFKRKMKEIELMENIQGKGYVGNEFQSKETDGFRTDELDYVSEYEKEAVEAQRLADEEELTDVVAKEQEQKKELREEKKAETKKVSEAKRKRKAETASV